MASGDTLCVFTPLHNEPPSSNPATLDQITARTGLRPVLDFDSATDETAIFTSVMPRHYSGSTGITVDIYGAMDSANTGTKSVVIDAALELLATNTGMGSGTSDSDFAAVNSVTATVDNNADDLFKATITFTDGADMDSVTAGSPFRFKITRDANNSADTASGDFQFIVAEIRDT